LETPVTIPSVREFRLSPGGSGYGVSCDARGAYIESIPLLKRTSSGQHEIWEPRREADISADLTSHYGLPIDVSSKAPSLGAIATALNEGNVAYAQLVTLHLNIPSSPRRADAAPAEFVKFVRELNASGLIKADWDSEKHPRWPSHTPGGKGGKFAPKDAIAVGAESDTASSGPGIGHNQGPPLEPIEEPPFAALGVALLAAVFLLASTEPLNEGEDEEIAKFDLHHAWPKYLGGLEKQILTKLPQRLHVRYHRALDNMAKRTLGKRHFEDLSPQERRALFRAIAEYSKWFDGEYGTHIYQDMIRNGFPVD
jgi:hypothetical protein